MRTTHVDEVTAAARVRRRGDTVHRRGARSPPTHPVEVVATA
ncbi:hypothetical protein ACFQL1_21200 [Halomicroarcula sp. GCM10025709]